MGVPHASPTRVAFPFVGDTVGGSDVSSVLLVRHLSKYGFEPCVISHTSGALTDYLTTQGVAHSVLKLPYSSEKRGRIGFLTHVVYAAPRLALTLRRQRVRIIHINDASMVRTWIPAAKLAGVPIVVHRRNPWFPSRLSHALYAMSHRIIAISEFARQTLPESLKAKADIIYNPFEATQIDRMQARARLTEVIGDDGIIVLSVGTLLERKRFDVFIEAAKRLREEHSGFRFAVVGRTTSLLDRLSAQVRDAGLDPCFTFTGYMPEVQTLVAGADVLVAPAIEEGYGRTLVEGMLSGVPVVASASGGHLEIVQDGFNGLLVEPGSPYALAKAVKNVALNKARSKELSDCANRWALDRFSPAKHAAEVAGVYRKLIGLSGAHSQNSAKKST